MSGETRKALEALTAAVPKMTDFERGRMFGYSQAITDIRESEEEKKEEQENVSNGKRNNNSRTATAEP